jgi:hypothetical protein
VLVRDGGPGQHYGIEHEAADGQEGQHRTGQQRQCRLGLVFPCLGASMAIALRSRCGEGADGGEEGFRGVVVFAVQHEKSLGCDRGAEGVQQTDCGLNPRSQSRLGDRWGDNDGRWKEKQKTRAGKGFCFDLFILR